MSVRKVLHVIPSAGPLRGGPSEMVRQLTTSLARAGIETHVATTNDNGAGVLPVTLNAPVHEDGVTYWYFPRQLHRYTVSLPLASWLNAHVADYDVVHIHRLFSFAPVAAALSAQRAGVPYIVQPFGSLNETTGVSMRSRVKHTSFQFVESGIVERASLMHYSGEDERIEAERLGVATPCVVIPSGVDPLGDSVQKGAFRSELGLLGGRRLVLFRATLDEKSGLDIVLQAFKRMRSRVADALLVVTGEGSTEFIARAKRDAKALGLGDEDVFWAEQLSAYGKRAALADADAFVLPSRSDNREVTIVEALGAGVPVVVSERVAMHREVGSKCAGIVVRCEPDEVAHALTIILTRPEFARAMGRWGVELVRQAYSADAVAQQMIDAYCSIAKTATSEDADAAFGEVETAS